MEPAGGDLAKHDHEFDEVRWVPFDSAATMLTFETERTLVAHAAAVLKGRAAPPVGADGRGLRRGAVVTDAADPPIHLTPLNDAHQALGARLIEFSGWLMPVQYGSIIEEHRTVRTNGRPVRPVAHGRAVRRRPGGRSRPRRGPRVGPAQPGGRPGALLDDVACPTAGSSTT